MARTKQAGRESTRKRKAAEASESDDGFISADEGTAPKSKKTKTATASKSSSDAKEPSWDLGSSKRATISEFKGNTYINIREYYQKNGEFLPGKKGVMLNLECWSELVKCAGEINGKLGEKGLLVEGGEEEEEKKGKVVAKVEKKKEKKSNIEVTSDEEEVEAEGGEEEDDDKGGLGEVEVYGCRGGGFFVVVVVGVGYYLRLRERIRFAYGLRTVLLELAGRLE